MHQSSHQLDIRHSYFADIHDVAHAIQTTLATVLREPDKGVYLPNQLEPVMRAGYPYWYQETVFLNKVQHVERPNPEPGMYPVMEELRRLNNQPWQYYRYNYIRVENFEQVLTTPFDVVDMGLGFVAPYYNPHDEFPGSDAQPRRTVLPHHRAHEATLTPTLPWAGIRIAHQMIENEISSTRYFGNSPAKTLEEIALPFVSEAYLPPTIPDSAKIDHMRSDRWFHQALNNIFENMLLVLTPIRNVLRNNPYQMCSVNYNDGYQIRIDQLGDYRIHEWERIVNDPDYQQFLRAKANGTLAQLYPADPSTLYR
jgi:hypothetical protein